MNVYTVTLESLTCSHAALALVISDLTGDVVPIVERDGCETHVCFMTSLDYHSVSRILTASLGGVSNAEGYTLRLTRKTVRHNIKH